MNRDMISDELCELDLNVQSTDEFFHVISQKAKRLGYITEGFCKAIQAREQAYPTALPIYPYPVAIPHSEPMHILQHFIAPIRLQHAIDWYEMANNERILRVRLIFLLGFKKEEGHTQLLQALLENFQDVAIMNSLLWTQNKEEFLRIVRCMKGL